MPRSQWNLGGGLRNSLLPCPLVIANDNLITYADIVLRPGHPRMEEETRDSPSVDRTTFLIPYLSHNDSSWCIRSFSFRELLSMYTFQISIPSDSTLVPSHTLLDLSSMLY